MPGREEIRSRCVPGIARPLQLRFDAVERKRIERAGHFGRFSIYSYETNRIPPVDRIEPALSKRPGSDANAEPRHSQPETIRHRHFNPAAWADDWRKLRQFSRTHAWKLVFLSGIIIRVIGICSGRILWLDESMLYQNLIDTPVFRPFGPLKQEQVVPPGFLTLTRAIFATFGDAVFALRFPAFLAGTAAFVIFAAWARRSLPRPAGWIAAWLMALNADAIYYCQEMKPYAFDLLSTVALTALLGERLRVPAGSAEMSLSRWRWRAGIFLAVIPWFSIAAAFPAAAFLAVVMASNGTDRKGWQAELPMATAWGVSFLAAWMIEKSQVVEGSVLWSFWDFAFLKPHALRDSLCVLGDNLINPLHLMTAIDSPRVMFPWAFGVLAVLGLGLAKTGQVSPWLAIFGVLTTGLIAAASVARAYPFHGRTILVLLPFALTNFASGIASMPVRNLPARVLISLMAVLTPTVSPLIVEPFSDSRLVSFDGDLEHDHFIRTYGVIKRANAPPPNANTRN